jgi:hypothetical protein
LCKCLKLFLCLLLLLLFICNNTEIFSEGVCDVPDVCFIVDLSMVTFSYRRPASYATYLNYCIAQFSSVRDCPYYCLLYFLMLSNATVLPDYFKLIQTSYFINYMRVVSPGNFFTIIKLGTAFVLRKIWLGHLVVLQVEMYRKHQTQQKCL